MDCFHKQQDVLYCEQVSCQDIVRQFGTPVYVYSRQSIESRWQAFHRAFGATPHSICYAVKACSNIAILDILAKLGSGFDIVSGGELERVRCAGGRLDTVVFSGVGKTAAEIELAINSNIKCLHIESAAELDLIEQIAEHLNKAVAVGLRVNLDMDVATHPYIATGHHSNKFGVSIEEAAVIARTIAEHPLLRLSGLACHIGSHITALDPFREAAQGLLAYADTLCEQGHTIEHIDFGGGYSTAADAPSTQEYIQSYIDVVGTRPYEIVVEPGRAIVGESGILLTQVMYLKERSETRSFAIVDAAMNDFIRPALYQAKHALQLAIGKRDDGAAATEKRWDIVGPVCESGDFLAQDMCLSLAEGDVLALMSAGAYGFSMSSNYNSRPRAAEVLVDGQEVHLIRQRETFSDLIKTEQRVPPRAD